MYYTREWRYARNAGVRREANDECQRLAGFIKYLNLMPYV